MAEGDLWPDADFEVWWGRELDKQSLQLKPNALRYLRAWCKQAFSQGYFAGSHRTLDVLRREIKNG